MILTQVLQTILFYIAVIAMFRLAGKRLAGQTTTFDLIILISLGVTIQQATLEPGRGNQVTFIVTCFVLHLLNTKVCAAFPSVRRLVRGAPSQLICDGVIMHSALRDEGLSVAELEAGLRKLGYDDVSRIKCAHIEETGQISAVAVT